MIPAVKPPGNDDSTRDDSTRAAGARARASVLTGTDGLGRAIGVVTYTVVALGQLGFGWTAWAELAAEASSDLAGGASGGAHDLWPFVFLFGVLSVTAALPARGATAKVLVGTALGLAALLPGGWLHALAAACLGGLAARHRHDTFAALALGFAPVGVFSAVGVAPSALGAAALCGVLGLALVGGVLVHARAVSRRASGTPPVLAVAGRLALGAGVALGTLALALPLLVVIDTARRSFGATPEDAADAAARRGAAREAARAGAPNGRDPRPSEATAEAFEFAGGDPSSLVSDAEVLRVRRGTPSRPGEGLYLRHLVLDQFGPDGLSASDQRAPRRRFDPDDGARDGWVRLADPRQGTEAVRYTCEARPLRLGDRAWTILPLPQPALAVSVEPVRVSADGPSVVDGALGGWFRYTCEAEQRRFERSELAAAVAGPRRARDLALPEPTPALRSLELLARRVMRDAVTDSEKVLAVVGYLRSLDYSLESTTFEGVAGLAEFVERRRGYCTHFASTAALLLRLVGVPARVAVGFLARDLEDGSWLARERDAHAWLEVPFEGLGWLSFDPTPADGTLGGLAAGWSPLRDEPVFAARATSDLGRWWLAVREAFARFAGGDGDLGAAVGRAVGAAPPVVWVGLGSLAVLGGLLVAWRRRRAPHRDPRQRVVRASGDLWVQLDRWLARRGLARPPGRTPLAHAEALASAAPGLEVLPELVRSAYRERFGGGLDPAQSLRGQALMEQLAARESDGNTS